MAEAEGTTTTTALAEDEVALYRIHVSSRYLDLTKQKLELTRLPHENGRPQSADWWEPKPQVEPLIDFWLEQYSWRDQEDELNKSLPQYRTAIKPEFSPVPIRIHFIHARSPHANAVPLLLIPPFPLTNLSLGSLVAPLTDPEDAGQNQPFHLIIPSLPGLGFSDALPNNTSPAQVTADLLDALMGRLKYPHYIASSAGCLSTSPADIDWRILKSLSNDFSKSCLGVHAINPPLLSPKLGESPVAWTKWTVANFFHSSMMGYSKDDFAAIRRLGKSKRGAKKTLKGVGMFGDGDLDPNTLSYALCDSPTGLLLYVLKMLRVLDPAKELSPAEIITLTELLWLPGPEAALRFWAQAASRGDNEDLRRPAHKFKMGVTVFLGEEDASENRQQQRLLPRPASSTYACPAWAHSRYQVLSLQRVKGKPGFLIRDKPEVIIDGARALAKAILATDKRMQQAEQPGAVLLEQVVDEGGRTAPADLSGTTVQETGEVSPGLSAKAQGKQVESPIQDEAGFLVPPGMGSKKPSSSGESSQQAS